VLSLLLCVLDELVVSVRDSYELSFREGVDVGVRLFCLESPLVLLNTILFVCRNLRFLRPLRLKLLCKISFSARGLLSFFRFFVLFLYVI